MPLSLEEPTKLQFWNQKHEHEKTPEKSRQREERKKLSPSENTAIPSIDKKRKILSIHSSRMITNHIQILIRTIPPVD